MAIKASASITLSFMVDIKAVYRYYKLQASTASAPNVPTTNPPSGWTDTEPSYTSGSTNTLYTVELTVFTNNTFLYSAVSKSSSYEAAKEAYNKAQNAQNTANNAQSSATNANNKIDNLQIGGRNYILNGSGTEKKGFFKNFNVVDSDGYYMVTLSSRKTYSNISLYGGFVLNVREYVPGSKVTFSYDIMYTQYDFPEGSDRQELWMGQRYTAPSWLAVTQHSLPAVGSNGCELNEWYHVEKVLTIPAQADEEVGSADNIQFYNSNADVTATVTFKLRNVKLEYGNKATDWTPAPEDTDEKIDNAQTSADNAQNAADNAQSSADNAQNSANEANNKAESAQNSANSAQNKADGAYDLAGDAFNKADEASKVATNYLDFQDDVGLIVGDMRQGNLGKNVRLDSDSVDIRNGNSVLASFGANRIDLGNDSNNAIIAMRGNSLNISTYNKGEKDYTQIVTYGNMDVSALSDVSTENYKRGGMQTTLETVNMTTWRNIDDYKWSGLSSYTWEDLHGEAFVADRDLYFETRMYVEDIDGTTSNGYSSAEVSLSTNRQAVDGGADKLVSEVDISGDTVNINGTSAINFTGVQVIFDRSLSTKNGRINIRTGASGTQAIQQTFGWTDTDIYAAWVLNADKALALFTYENGTLKSNPLIIYQNGSTSINGATSINGEAKIRNGNSSSSSGATVQSFGFAGTGSYAYITMTTSNLRINMADNGTYKSTPIHIEQSGVASVGCQRFNNEWFGFYASNYNASVNGYRKAWMGHDGSTNFTIYNEAGGNNQVNKAWTTVSDRRLKEDIENIPEEFINVWKELHPKAFRWNDLNYDSEHKYQFGLIAQDVIDAFEKYNLDWRDYNVVTPFKMMDDDTEYFSVTYDNYHMLTSLALKDAVKKHDLLQSEIDALKVQNDSLQNQINELKALVESVLKK